MTESTVADSTFEGSLIGIDVLPSGESSQVLLFEQSKTTRRSRTGDDFRGVKNLVTHVCKTYGYQGKILL